MWRTITDSLDIGLGLAKIYRSEKWSANRVSRYQERMLVQQLRYAVTDIPYYRDLGIKPEDIRSSDSLKRFPKLNKSIVQRDGDRLCNPDILSRGALKSLTSGSSGEPTVTWFDRRSWNFCKYALKIRRTLLAGAPWRQRQLLFDESMNSDGSIAEPAHRRLGPFHQVRMSVFTPIEKQLDVLQAVNPTVIYGTPSGVKELCDHAARLGLRVPSVSIVFLSSELISEAVRQQVEAFFDAKVIGIYGTTEFKDLCQECEEGHYHTYFQSAVIEVEPDTDADTGRLLITSLTNKAMPLIRFDIGDYGKLGIGQCKCGRASPYLTNIVGREIEFLQLRDGNRLSPYRLTTAVETVPGLLKYRFIQADDLSLRMEVVLGDSEISVDAQIERIRSNIQQILGDDVDLPVHVVDEIGRTAGGKHGIVSRSSE